MTKLDVDQQNMVNTMTREMQSRLEREQQMGS